jgi:hypothetical protein
MGLPLTTPPPIETTDQFDEAGYLRTHLGVAEAIMQGRAMNAQGHYLDFGRAEGRSPNDVNPEFYLTAYPDIAADLGHPPSADDAAVHFVTLGRARGYLPNATAARAANAAAAASPFGGWWTDQANALDLIDARLALGRFRHADADMLRAFALDGLVVLSRPSNPEHINAAALIVAQSFTGQFDDLRFAAPGPSSEPLPWRPELTEQNVAALDPHMVSRRVRDLLLHPAVTDFLALLFDAPPRLTASRGYLRQAAMPDRDAAWHPHTLPLQFVAVTFDLDDNAEGSALAWPASHRLPDLPWAGEHVSLAEARRMFTPGLDVAVAHRAEQVGALLRDREPRRLECGFGVRVIRHANLIHAVEPPPPPLQRRVITAWYCPSFVAPCYVETAPARWHEHNGHAFASGVYPLLDPLD